MNRKIIAWALALLLLALPAQAEHSVSDVRARYAEIPGADALYDIQPDPETGEIGRFSAEAEQSMLAYARFMRWLAYVEDPLETSKEYGELAQAGALLLAANDAAAHALPQPEGFPDTLYETASQGIGGANIAAINWMDDDVLWTAIEFFQRDEGERNRFALGHRRWLLSPALQHTGFGMANAKSGMTYVTMYVHDFTAPSIDPWERIAWPSAGAFPAEYLYADTPWCLLLNPDVYPDPDEHIKITVSCEQTGEVFVMNRLAKEDAADAYWIDDDAYGLGVALIFRPWTEFEYEQNQHWRVRIEGLRRVDGLEESIEYQVNMISLDPVPVRLIELSDDSLSLLVGDSAALTANVVPAWADDLTVSWQSSDAAVATVDDAGCVRAVGEGRCVITVQSADGQYARCEVTVRAQ